MGGITSKSPTSRTSNKFKGPAIMTCANAAFPPRNRHFGESGVGWLPVMFMCFYCGNFGSFLEKMDK